MTTINKVVSTSVDKVVKVFKGGRLGFPDEAVSSKWTLDYKPATGIYRTQTHFMDASGKVVWRTKPMFTSEEVINSEVLWAGNKDILEHDWNHFRGSLGSQNNELAEGASTGFHMAVKRLLGNAYSVPTATRQAPSTNNYARQAVLCSALSGEIKICPDISDLIYAEISKQSSELPSIRLRILKEIKEKTESIKKQSKPVKHFYSVTADEMDQTTFVRQKRIINMGLLLARKNYEHLGSTYPNFNHKHLFKTTDFDPDVALES